MTSREEIAKREIGHTEISPSLTRTLALVFLLTIASVPAVQFAHDLVLFDRGERNTLLPQSMEALGLPVRALHAWRSSQAEPVSRILSANRETLRSIHTFEDLLEDRSLVGAWLRPRMQAVLTGALGVGNEQVYCGQDGWLFFRPAVDHLTSPGFLEARQLELRSSSGNEWKRPPQPNPLQAITEFHDQLTQRGITLLVVPVPVKASIHPEALSHRFVDSTAPVHNPSFPQLLADLAARGVRVIDPAPLIWKEKRKTSEEQYLQTDTHWTPQAMDLVAANLADAVREVLGTAENSGTRPADKPTDESRIGDLAEMLELPEVFPRQTVRVSAVQESSGSTARVGESADVLLLGDSFANIYAQEALGWGTDGGLAQRLGYHLRRPVNALIRNDDGAFATRLMLGQSLSEGNDLLADTRVVIWEFTARELSFGDWRSVRLEESPIKAEDFFVPPRGTVIVVEGTVAALAEIPDPTQAPYADYIVGLHLVDLGSESELEGRQALVFTWAMKKRQLTAGAEYRVGQRIRLELSPWADVDDRFGSVSRGELYDSHLLFQTPCWGEEVTP